MCGPVTPTTPSSNRFFFLLVDDLSCYMWLAVMRTKDQAMSVFVVFQARVEVEVERKLGTLRTDQGGEFTACTFIEYCTKEGIQQHLTAPYTSKQNGVIERRNQMVMGMAGSMLKAMAVPGRFWGWPWRWPSIS
jgi:transposase InsO family protein